MRKLVVDSNYVGYMIFCLWS